MNITTVLILCALVGLTVGGGVYGIYHQKIEAQQILVQYIRCFEHGEPKACAWLKDNHISELAGIR